MPAWIYVVAAAAVLMLAWVAFARRWAHAVWYSWRQASHAYQEVEAEYGSMPMFYGSMLPTGDAAEDAVTARMLWYGDISASPGGLGWREQTRVELAPETLDLLAAPAGPGPGGDARLSTTPPPGPDQPPYPDEPGKDGQLLVWRGDGFVWEDPPTPLQAQMAAILGQREPTRLADAGEVEAAHVAHPSPGWLEAQMADLFEWVRWMVPQVTGWSVRA